MDPRREEEVVVAGRELRLLRPPDAEALLDEEAFEHEERLPYWAELWPSALTLARAVGARALRGARTLELGCGLGLGALAAAVAGGRAVASDWSPDAVAAAAENAARNGLEVETLLADWARPEALLARAPWPLVLASDVLYERRHVELLLGLLPRLVDPRGEIWLADPGRPPAAAFLAGADELFVRRSAPDPERPRITLHRLRRR